MKYITKFENHAAYSAAESSLVEPNVSYCVNENEVHYKPIMPTPTRTPAVEIFADEACTMKPTGEVSKVYAKINRDFPFDAEKRWSDYLLVGTPTTQAPSDPFMIYWYLELGSVNLQSISEGDVEELTYGGGPSIDVTGWETQFYDE